MFQPMQQWESFFLWDLWRCFLKKGLEKGNVALLLCTNNCLGFFLFIPHRGYPLLLVLGIWNGAITIPVWGHCCALGFHICVFSLIILKIDSCNFICRDMRLSMVLLKGPQMKLQWTRKRIKPLKVPFEYQHRS